MNTPALHTHHPEETLALLGREQESPHPELRCERFEFSSRGDRVPALLLAPRQSARPLPLAILQPGGNAVPAGQFDEVAIGWARSGAAIVSVDLPLHGSRSSAKLSERLRAGLGRSHADDGVWQVLWSEFLIQAATDMSRALDAACELAAIDAGRVVCAAFELGAVAAVPFCANDSRLRALAVAPGEAAAGAAELRAIEALGQLAPRPLLVVDSEGTASQPFLEAAQQPRSSIVAGPAGAHAAMNDFLLEQLGLG